MSDRPGIEDHRVRAVGQVAGMFGMGQSRRPVSELAPRTVASSQAS